MSLLKHADRQLARQARHLNAFIARADQATCRSAIAEAIERSKSGKARSVIDGGLVAIKDNICTVDLPTTCASEILQGFRSPFDATVVKRVRDAGGIIIGKTNLDEFGMGSHNLNSTIGPTLNPYGHKGTPFSAGGSSGGSAAAVADDTCRFALGTDTGGSVRLPAAYCGVIGFKPSYGRISRFGVVAYANSLDTVGILGKDVESVTQLFEVLDAPDQRDPTCLNAKERHLIGRRLSANHDTGKLRIGIPAQYNVQELDPVIRRAWVVSAQKLMDAGHEIIPVQLPTTETALAAYYILAPAEASSNLAKYDGLRYGKPSGEPRSTEDVLFAKTRSDGLGKEVRRRILLGAYSLSSTAIDNYFLQAQRVRRQVQREFNVIFSQPHPLLDSDGSSGGGVDLLLTPTAPTLPPEISVARKRSPVEGYRDDVYTVPASLAGLPAISIPLRNELAGGEPVAMQLIGQYGDDDLVLKAASGLEQLLQQ